MPKTTYLVASDLNPIGFVETNKRRALQACRRENRNLRNSGDGSNLPPPDQWTDEQYEQHGYLIYDIRAERRHADGTLEIATVEPDLSLIHI